MKLTNRSKLVAAAVLLYTLAGIAPAALLAADPVDPAGWAPDNSLFFVGIPDCNRLAEAFKKTTAYRVMTEPKFESMFKSTFGLVEAVLEIIAQHLGLESVDELKVYPQGAAVFFVTLAPPAGEADEPEMEAVLLMDIGENMPQARALLRKITAALLEKGSRKQTEEVLSVKITTLHFPEPTEDEGEQEEEELPDALEEALADLELDPFQQMMLAELLAEPPDIDEVSYCTDGTTLIVASSAGEIGQTLRRLRGRSDKTLASSEAGRTLARKFAADAGVRMLFNVPLLIEMIERTEPESRSDFRAWGVDGLGAMVGSLEFAPEPGMDSRLHGFWPVRSDKPGLPAILRMKNHPVKPPATVSTAAAIYGFLNVDPKSVLKEVLDSLTRADPDAGQRTRASLKLPLPDGSVFDLEAQFFDHLRGPAGGQLVLAKPFDAANIGAQLHIAHNDREAMQKFLTVGPVAQLLQKREFLGSAIYESPMMPALGAGLAVTETALALGTTTQLERLIRAEGQTGPSLADDPRFKLVARQMPAQAWLAVYADSARLYEAQLAIHQAGDATEQPQFPFAASLTDLIRYGLGQMLANLELEDPQALRDYQGATMSTIRTEPDGLRFDMVTLVTPPAR